MIFFMPLLLDKWTDGRTERQTDGQNRRTDGPAHFSVRCHIEYIHSSKLLSPPSATKSFAEWLTFIITWCKPLIGQGGEKLYNNRNEPSFDQQYHFVMARLRAWRPNALMFIPECSGSPWHKLASTVWSACPRCMFLQQRTLQQHLGHRFFFLRILAALLTLPGGLNIIFF